MLRRFKRRWSPPPLNILENDQPPFPKTLEKVKLTTKLLYVCFLITLTNSCSQAASSPGYLTDKPILPVPSPDPGPAFHLMFSDRAASSCARIITHSICLYSWSPIRQPRMTFTTPSAAPGTTRIQWVFSPWTLKLGCFPCSKQSIVSSTHHLR